MKKTLHTVLGVRHENESATTRTTVRCPYFIFRWKERNIHQLIHGGFIMFSVIINIYNKKTKGPTLMELFTATEKLKMVLLDN